MNKYAVGYYDTSLNGIGPGFACANRDGMDLGYAFCFVPAITRTEWPDELLVNYALLNKGHGLRWYVWYHY